MKKEIKFQKREKKRKRNKSGKFDFEEWRKGAMCSSRASQLGESQQRSFQPAPVLSRFTENERLNFRWRRKTIAHARAEKIATPAKIKPRAGSRGERGTIPDQFEMHWIFKRRPLCPRWWRVRGNFRFGGRAARRRNSLSLSLSLSLSSKTERTACQKR